MTAKELDLRIRQMHLSLLNLTVGDATTITPKVQELAGGGYYCAVDFSEGTTGAGLHNIAEQLVANIARIKDHLKAWCSKAKKPFEGDDLINSNKTVAIVHDLWNTQKHAVLTHPPRSGHRPHLENLQQALGLSSGEAADGMAVYSFDPRTGIPTVHTTDGASAKIVIDADIVDDKGARLGSFATTCEEAVSLWEQALARSGVPLPEK